MAARKRATPSADAVENPDVDPEDGQPVWADGMSKKRYVEANGWGDEAVADDD